MISAVNDFSGNGLDHIFFQNDNGAVAMTGFPKKEAPAPTASATGATKVVQQSLIYIFSATPQAGSLPSCATFCQ